MSLIGAGPCEVTFLSPLTAKQAQDLRGCVATKRRAGAQRALVPSEPCSKCSKAVVLCVWYTLRRDALGRGAHMHGAYSVGWELSCWFGPFQKAFEACGSFLNVTGQLPCDPATTLLGTFQEVTTGPPNPARVCSPQHQCCTELRGRPPAVSGHTCCLPASGRCWAARWECTAAHGGG